MRDLDQLQRLLQERAYLRGQFRLSSGRTSDHYFDAKLVTLDPEGMLLIGKLVFEMIRPYGAQAVGGLTIGADPIAIAVAQYAWSLGTRLPAFIVRKDPKEHGLSKYVEGPLPEGGPLAVVDDVITSGQSVLRAVDTLNKHHSCKVVVVAALVDRGEGGSEAIRQSGYKFNALFTADDVSPRLSTAHSSV